MKVEPKTHAQLGNTSGTWCGTRSAAAIGRCSDCDRCRSRMDSVVTLLLDAAEGQDVAKKAKALCGKLGIERIAAPPAKTKK